MSKNKKLTLIIAIPAALILITGVILFFVLKGSKDTPDPAAIPPVTLSQYEQIQKGQSYDEVFAILGSKGVMSSGEGDTNDPDYIVSYNWFGSKPGSVAVVVFHGGKVSYKTYLGLTD